MSPAPDVMVRRLVAQCRLPPSGSEADLRTALHDLTTPLQAASAGLEGFWLLRRLDVTTRVGSRWGPDEVSRAVARTVAAGVRRRARAGVDSATVRWWPDREAFVADYLLDVARGLADGRWEYAALPASGSWPDRALALARQDGATLAGALAGLSPADLDALAEQVRGDRLLEALAGPDGATAPVVAATRRLRATGRLTATGSTALVLALEAAGARFAEVGQPSLAAAGLVRLAAAPGADPARVLAAVRAGRWRDLTRLVGPDDAFLPLLGWSEDERAALVDALAGPRPAPAVDLWPAGTSGTSGSGGAAPVEVRHTRFGGALLLLPLLDGLGDWPTLADGLPPAGDLAPDRPLRLAVLAAALGPPRFGAVLEDPVLRIALGVSVRQDVRAWLDALEPDALDAVGSTFPAPAVPDQGWEPPVRQQRHGRALGRAARTLLADLGRRLPGMAAASPAYLWQQVLDLDARVTLTGAGPDGDVDPAGGAPGEALVELGHSPLQVLLSMTGLAATGFVVAGVGERRWTLTSRS